MNPSSPPEAGLHGRPASRTAWRELSARARCAVDWFKQLARTIKSSRIYLHTNPLLTQMRDELWQALTRGLDEHGPWNLRVTPVELWLDEEPIIQPSAEGGASPKKQEEDLPFQIYRDGIRGLTFLPGIPRPDLDALVDGLIQTGPARGGSDDLLTLLWLSNATHLQVDSVPLEQEIFLLRTAPTGAGGGGARTGQTYAWSPAGGDIRADLGAVKGPQGLHLDNVDDWELPEETGGVEEACPGVLAEAQTARERLRKEWNAELAVPIGKLVPRFLAELRAALPGEELRAALAHAIATWLAAAMQRSDWEEAQAALPLLRELDPDGSLTTAELTESIAGFDTATLCERLDEADPEEQGAFLGLAAALGRPALPLASTLMADGQRSRTRAAACTLLCYLCGDEPGLLAPFVEDSRWTVVRNAAFVLGQIGGHEVVELLARAATHPDVQVRRQVVQSLAAVPRDDHIPILLAQLDTGDQQLLASTLNLLTREPDPYVAMAIGRWVTAPDFESRYEEHQRMLLNALAEVGGDAAVPTLQAILNKGAWFARRSFERSAAARCLARIGTPAAKAALDAAMRSRSEAVRHAAAEALAREEKA